MEGDGIINLIFMCPPQFLSTPSGWRATCLGIAYFCLYLYISIHALRVEGDDSGVTDEIDFIISIHALRVEGDYHLFSDCPLLV